MDPISGIALKEAGVELGAKSIEREAGNYKAAIEYIRNIPKSIVKETVMIGPDFIKFTITALKQKDIDTKTKLIQTGIIVSLSTLLGFMIWDISLITMLFAIGAFAGPLTIIGGVVFGSLIILIKSALTAFLVLISMKLSNLMYDDEQFRKIADEAFGKEKGESFSNSFGNIMKSIPSGIEKFGDSVTEYFEKIGSKKKNLDTAKLLDTIEKKDDKSFSIKKFNPFSKKEKEINEIPNDERMLNELLRENPLNEDLIILMLSLFRKASAIDGTISIAEQNVFISFLKEEYFLDDEDISQFFNSIDSNKNIKELLSEIKEYSTIEDLEHIVKVVYDIISIDGKITNEENKFYTVIKKQLLPTPLSLSN